MKVQHYYYSCFFHQSSNFDLLSMNRRYFDNIFRFYHLLTQISSFIQIREKKPFLPFFLPLLSFFLYTIYNDIENQNKNIHCLIVSLVHKSSFPLSIFLDFLSFVGFFAICRTLCSLFYFSLIE